MFRPPLGNCFARAITNLRPAPFWRLRRSKALLSEAEHGLPPTGLAWPRRGLAASQGVLATQASQELCSAFWPRRGGFCSCSALASAQLLAQLLAPPSGELPAAGAVRKSKRCLQTSCSAGLYKPTVCKRLAFGHLAYELCSVVKKASAAR